MIRTMRGTLKFRVGSFPVHVVPIFWIAVAFIIFYSRRPIELKLSWIVILFVSILVHELGHAVMQRSYGMQSTIIMHGMGGMAYGTGAQLSASERIVVSVAGPLTELLLLGLPAWALNQLWDPGGNMGVILRDIVWINVIWALVNLLPALPLDGGHIADNVAYLVTGEYQTRRINMLSIGIGVVGIVIALGYGLPFGAGLALIIIILNVISLARTDIQFAEMSDPSDEQRRHGGGGGNWDVDTPPRRRRKGFKKAASKAKPAELLAAGYDLLERHDPVAARERIAPLLANKGRRHERAHAQVIAAWALLREGAPAAADAVLDEMTEQVPGATLARLVVARSQGTEPIEHLAGPISTALGGVDAQRDARQAVEVLVRRNDTVPLAKAMLATMDLDGVLRLQQLLHEMGRREMAQAISDLLLSEG